MQNFWKGCLLFLKALASMVYSFQEQKIKLSSIGLNSITFSLTYILLRGFAFIIGHAKTAQEFALAMAAFLAAILPMYGSMLYSIYKGSTAKETVDLMTAAGNMFKGQSTTTNTLNTTQSTVTNSAVTKTTTPVANKKVQTNANLAKNQKVMAVIKK